MFDKIPSESAKSAPSFLGGLVPVSCVGEHSGKEHGSQSPMPTLAGPFVEGMNFGKNISNSNPKFGLVSPAEEGEIQHQQGGSLSLGVTSWQNLLANLLGFFLIIHLY